MVRVEAHGDHLQIEVLGWRHKFLAFKGRLTIPLTHIKSVRIDATVLRNWWKGWRCPGTELPGLVAGSFYLKGHWHFWDVSRCDSPLVIELVDDPYDRLILEVEDPADTVRRIQGALAPADRVAG